MTRLLVIGGSGGIGSAVVARAKEYAFEVTSADEHDFDIANGAQVVKFFNDHDHFDHVVVASGMNVLTQVGALGLQRHMTQMLAINATGPVVACQAWIKKAYGTKFKPAGHFVVVSSNSAHLPRSQSIGYCASKAAISMAVQCIGRAVADSPLTVWAVEPGWVDDTPLSRRIARQLPEGVAPHRIPGNRTNKPDDVANFILSGIRHDVRQFNGTCFPLDGGEL